MRRSTVVMLVILAILAGLYWYMQQPDNAIQRATQPTPTATSINLGSLVGPEQGQVIGIFIKRSDRTSVSLDKSMGIWMLLTAENQVPAAATVDEQAASSISALRILRRLDPAPEASSIGLDNPAYQFVFLTTAGSRIEFKVGAKTATQSGYYVQTADGSVYIVAAFGIDSLSGYLDYPPYLSTPTPLPRPATETPVPALTPEPAFTSTPTT